MTAWTALRRKVRVPNLFARNRWRRNPVAALRFLAPHEAERTRSQSSANHAATAAPSTVAETSCRRRGDVN